MSFRHNLLALSVMIAEMQINAEADKEAAIQMYKDASKYPRKKKKKIRKEAQRKYEVANLIAFHY